MELLLTISCQELSLTFLHLAVGGDKSLSRHRFQNQSLILSPVNILHVPQHIRPDLKIMMTNCAFKHEVVMILDVERIVPVIVFHLTLDTELALTPQQVVVDFHPCPRHIPWNVFIAAACWLPVLSLYNWDSLLKAEAEGVSLL